MFPSEIEAMSMMLLEVISCGVPVLASDIAENVEITGPDYPWLFRNADPANLAEKLARFLRDGPGTEIAALRAKGIACEPVRIDEFSNKPFTFFFDPDGLPLELHG